MAQQDRKSVRSASKQAPADGLPDRVRVIRIKGTGDEARALVLREAEQLGETSALEIEVDFDPGDSGDLRDALRSRGVSMQGLENARPAFCLVIRHSF